MNQFLDIPAELDRLERSLEEHLSSHLLETSRTVLDTLRIRPDREPRWTERLSPLVVLYPLLQSQAWSDRPTEAVCTATVVHMFLLMHTFIDDRVIDNQHPLTPAEIVLAKQAALVAQRIARESSLLPPPVDRLWFDSFERYHGAQLQHYAQSGQTMAEEALDAHEQIVADRAALGQLGVIVACHTAGRADLQPALSRAFNDLAVGLQWEDDLMDWPHDFATDQQNLLLASLGAHSSPADSDTDERLRFVDERFIERGTYAFAVDKARLRLATAEREQRRFGSDQLADAIAERQRSLQRLGMHMERQIAFEDHR